MKRFKVLAALAAALAVAASAIFLPASAAKYALETMQIQGGPYDFVNPFSCGLAQVELNGKLGFVNESGEVVAEPIYDNASSFSYAGIADVSIGGTYGVIDAEGNYVFELSADYMYSAIGKYIGRVNVQNGHTALLDADGELLIGEDAGYYGYNDYGGYIEAFCFADTDNDGHDDNPVDVLIDPETLEEVPGFTAADKIISLGYVLEDYNTYELLPEPYYYAEYYVDESTTGYAAYNSSLEVIVPRNAEIEDFDFYGQFIIAYEDGYDTEKLYSPDGEMLMEVTDETDGDYASYALEPYGGYVVAGREVYDSGADEYTYSAALFKLAGGELEELIGYGAGYSYFYPGYGIMIGEREMDNYEYEVAIINEAGEPQTEFMPGWAKPIAPDRILYNSYYSDSKTRLLDGEGEELAVFDLFEFYHGVNRDGFVLAPPGEGSDAGIIDFDGNILLPFEYDNLIFYDPNERLQVVEKDGEFYIVELFTSTVLTDQATGISVDAEAQVLPNGAQLSVAAVTSGANLALAQGALSGFGSFKLYDVSLQKNGAEVQPDGSITVRIPVPAGYDAAQCKLFRIGADGAKTEIPVTAANGVLTATLTHLSLYAVTQPAAAAPGGNTSSGTVTPGAGGTTPDGTANPPTGAGYIVLAAALAALCFAGAAAITLRRKSAR